MEGLELICFEIISSVGMARSLYIEAIQEAKAGNFEQAQELFMQMRTEESFSFSVDRAVSGKRKTASLTCIPERIYIRKSESKKRIRETRGEQNDIHQLRIKSGIYY